MFVTATRWPPNASTLHRADGGAGRLVQAGSAAVSL